MQQQALGAETSGLLDATATIKALVQDASVRQPHKALASNKPSNPLYLLGAITLGIPALSLIPLVGMNPAVQEGMLATLTMLLGSSALLVAAIFEIKRLVDQPGDGGTH